MVILDPFSDCNSHIQEISEVVRVTGKQAIRALLIDFGGVIADEGFRDGLFEIARRNGHDPEPFYHLAQKAVYSSGYVINKGTTADFWNAMRSEFALNESDDELSQLILERFILRQEIIEAVRSIRDRGIICCILSDQTDWLEQLDASDHFYREFDRVYNSYRLGKGKKDATLFDDVINELGLLPETVAFIDDSPGNVERARSRGIIGMTCADTDSCLSVLQQLL